MGCVYLARNRVNNKRYVGKTIKSLVVRICGHKAHAKHGKSQMPFVKALAKYGHEQFEWTVLLESDSNEELCKVERVMIAMLKTKSPKGYNITDGGEGAAGWHPSSETRAKIGVKANGRKASAETRAKMSALRKGKKRPPRSAEWRANQVAVMTGRKASAETRAKMSAARKGKGSYKRTEWIRAKQSASHKGYKHTPEARAKMSAARKGKKKPPRSAEHCARLSAALKNRKKLTP